MKKRYIHNKILNLKNFLRYSYKWVHPAANSRKNRGKKSSNWDESK